MLKHFSILFLVFSALAQDSNRPGTITQTGGTMAWPFPGVTLTVRPDLVIQTNVLTLTISADVVPLTVYNIAWMTNGPQPSSVSFLSPNSTQTVVTLGANGTYNLLAVVNDGPRFVGRPMTIIANAPMNTPPTIGPLTDQSINQDTSGGSQSFTVGDAETPVGLLSVTAASSNPGLIDSGGLILGGTGSTRSLGLSPKAGASGHAVIYVVVTDGNVPPLSTTNSFNLTVNAVNALPSFSVVDPVALLEDASPASFTVNVADADTPLSQVTLTATTDAAFVQSLSVTGTGASRTVNLVLVPNGYGTNSIQLKVSDGQNTVQGFITLKVFSINDPPTISPIGPLMSQVGTPTSASFTIGDVEDGVPPNILRSTDNSLVLPLANLVLSGTGTARQVTATPASAGTANASVTVFDSNGASASRTFTVTGTALANTPPTVTAPADQTVWKSQPTASLPVTVADAETPATALGLAAVSSNPGLLANNAIAISGSGGTRSLVATPTINQVGTATVTLTVTDGAGATGTDSFNVVVNATNYPPALGPITSPQNIAENGTLTLPLTVSDPDTALGSVTVTGVCADLTLVPAPNITVSGTGANRNMVIVPATNKYGTNNVTVTANDGAGGTFQRVFSLQVAFVNQLPTITALSDVTVALNTPSTQSFTVGDLETPAANLTVSGQSSNPALVPNNKISFGGSGASRNVTVTPNTGISGSANITVSVTDANNESKADTFVFVVNPGGGTRIFYVSPSGISGNTGVSTSSPWNLGSVLSPGTKGLQGGDRVYLMGGDYGRGPGAGGRWVVTGAYASPIIFKGLARPYTADAAVFNIAMSDTEALTKSGPPCIAFGSGSANIWLWGLELKNTGYRLCDTSAQSGRAGGFYIDQRGNGNKIINCLVHDAENGIAWQDADSLPGGNVETYGCITYGNGVCEYRAGEGLSKDHGHGFYNQAKNQNFTMVVSDCVSHNNQGQGHQSSGSDGKVFWHYTLEGSAFYNNGMPSGSRSRNIYFGLGNKFSDVTIRSNYTYYPSTGGPSLFTCAPSVNSGTIGDPPFMSTNLLVINNWAMGGNLLHGRWENATIINNVFQGWAPYESITFRDQYPHPNNILDSNTVYGIATPYHADNAGFLNRQGWQDTFGFGVHDTQIVGNPSGQMVVMRVNKYDPDLAMVIIYNWSRAATVSLNLAGFLVNGDTYDLYNTSNPKVRAGNGLYSGAFQFPMTGFPLYTHVGTQSGSPALIPQSPEPEFAVLHIVRSGHPAP